MESELATASFLILSSVFCFLCCALANLFMHFSLDNSHNKTRREPTSILAAHNIPGKADRVDEVDWVTPDRVKS